MSQHLKDYRNNLKNRTVEKVYKALVIGKINDRKFEINAPISRNPNNRFKYAVVVDGKEAYTQFELDKVVEIPSYGFVSLLSAFPKTGRTHQIRVHLAALNHPVVGDPIYCTKQQIEEGKGHFSRLMLHAERISFTHPTTGEKVVFSSNLPQEFML